MRLLRMSYGCLTVILRFYTDYSNVKIQTKTKYKTTRFSQKASPIRVLFEFYSCSMRPYFVLTSWLLIIQMLKFKIKRDMKHSDFSK